MIEIKDLKPNMLVWWSAERYMSSWSCPAIVKKVDKKAGRFTVMSLDNFKEVELRLYDPEPGVIGDMSTRHEMRACAKEEVADYFLRQQATMEDLVTAATRDFRRAESRLATTKSRQAKFLAEVLLP